MLIGLLWETKFTQNKFDLKASTIIEKSTKGLFRRDRYV